MPEEIKIIVILRTMVILVIMMIMMVTIMMTLRKNILAVLNKDSKHIHEIYLNGYGRSLLSPAFLSVSRRKESSEQTGSNGWMLNAKFSIYIYTEIYRTPCDNKWIWYWISDCKSAWRCHFRRKIAISVKRPNYSLVYGRLPGADRDTAITVARGCFRLRINGQILNWNGARRKFIYLLMFFIR